MGGGIAVLQRAAHGQVGIGNADIQPQRTSKGGMVYMDMTQLVICEVQRASVEVAAGHIQHITAVDGNRVGGNADSTAA